MISREVAIIAGLAVYYVGMYIGYKMGYNKGYTKAKLEEDE